MTAVRIVAFACAIAVASGCRENAPLRAEARTEPRAPEARAEAETPPEEEPTSAPAPPPPPVETPPEEPPLPEGDARCARYGEATRVIQEPGPASVVASGDGFVVASYALFGSVVDRVVIAHVPLRGAPVVLGTARLDEPLPRLRGAPPGLSAANGRVLIGVIDGRARVLLASVEGRRIGRLTTIAEGADPRFPPAIAPTDRADLVAYTKGAATMRLLLVRRPRDGSEQSEHDVTPVAMGGAAPAFVLGADPPRLLFVDARVATSPLLEVTFDEASRPSEARVLRPLANLFEPADIVAVAHAERTWIGYTAVGNAASTAVGLVRDGDDAPAPVAIVPGYGYGILGVDAALGPSGPLFVADAPRSDDPHSPRIAKLRALGENGLEPAETIVGPEGHATHAAIAATPDGEVAVAFTTPSGVYVQRLRCR